MLPTFVTRTLHRRYYKVLYSKSIADNLILSIKYDGQYRCLASSFFRNPRKIESYFSAIGGESDDPPPDLTPEQVTAILRTNESLVLNNAIAAENVRFLENFIDVLESKKFAKNKKFEAIRRKQRRIISSEKQPQPKKLYSLIDHPWISQIESNQLASNHPIEDRLRVSAINLDDDDDNEDSRAIIFGVFDGHGGGFCADVIARRLFHYIAIGLKARHLNSTQPKETATIDANDIAKIVSDHSLSPTNFYHNIHSIYEAEVSRRLQSRIEEFEMDALQKFANDELENSSKIGDDIIKSILERAFIRCDEDLSREIETNLTNTTSNLLLHYYHSLAVSGSCATVALVIGNILYIASTGDCRAVMGMLRVDDPQNEVNQQSKQRLSSLEKKQKLRVIELSREHNSDNVNELNRIYSEHPKEEHNFIIREHRLLGQLMPLRAFGDFPFKWSVDKMKQLGLTRAFGSHVIPTFYRTPPYLIVTPEITMFDLEQDGNKWLDRFVVIATDGLWEQFESSRKVVKAVNRYRQHFNQQIMTYRSAQVFKIEPINDEDEGSSSLTLQEIIDRLSKQVKHGPITTFKRVTADDDLIEDINCGTFLLRTALSEISVNDSVPRPNIGRIPESDPLLIEQEEEREKFSHHVDQYEQQKRRHQKLVSYLTLPQSVVRNFRDDISLIVMGLK
ncbi:Pyruvate dehydrogenase[acetyl-transferring]-phosphatase 1-like [Euroglyphus maynei]|uniref:Pyruvate dehydrogenase[acetyl-transferring]-phosphatase 1-like n=1 Tax=Euroglyphus maynei TaxID=6958 RepID=A0A1Y3BVR8_EURMA|nr:Pyruvate dehydrogenase[acetyl-transferring]-phosphatase 1-like [Euroglyphus maynei]